MLPQTTIRGWYLDQMRKGLQIVSSILATTTEQDATTYRDGGTGWTVLEVLCHLRDYELIFMQRARMTVDGDTSEFYNPNPDQLASDSSYNADVLPDVYAEWLSRRTAYLTYLTALDDEAWQREGRHPRRGMMTLQDQLTLTAWHDVNHIEQITRILAEKKLGG